MKYFLFNTLGDTSNDDYCFTSDTPEGGIDSWDLIAGYRIANEYPGGIEEVTLKLEDQFPGLVLASYIGNPNQMLAFSKKAADLIISIAQSEIEVIPFTLLTPKGKVYSNDYVFINPVGAIDCINWKETDCSRRKNGDVSSFDKLVLDKKKIDNPPHLFRLKYLTNAYIFSEVLTKSLLDKNHTNLIFSEIEMA
ncbi:imm11 family protein [Hahella sp. NBU794]|uniref:imm11 family protein n=1 Tax=Hahella sp. NBU794 TaxID=3422590 RepID=UPI003D6F7BBC